MTVGRDVGHVTGLTADQSWWLAIGLATAGNISENAGFNLVNFSHLPLAQSMFLTPTQFKVIGWTLFCTGNVALFAALAFAAQTMVSALGALQFISNVYFVYLATGRKPNKSQILGTFLVITGNVIVVKCAAKNDKVYTSDELLELFLAPLYLSYLLGCVGGSLFFFLLYNGVLERMYTETKEDALRAEIQRMARSRAISLSGGGGLALAHSTTGRRTRNSSSLLGSKIHVDARISDPNHHVVRPISRELSSSKSATTGGGGGTKKSFHGGFSSRKLKLEELEKKALFEKDGPLREANCWQNAIKNNLVVLRPAVYTLAAALIGHHAAIYGKGCASVLAVLFAGEPVYKEWFSYVIPFLLFAFIAFWLKHLNIALKRFDGAIAIPTLQIFWIIGAITGGGVFYHEFDEFTVERWIGFWGGVVLVVIGVYLLAPDEIISAETGDRPLVEKQQQLDPPPGDTNRLTAPSARLQWKPIASEEKNAATTTTLKPPNATYGSTSNTTAGEAGTPTRIQSPPSKRKASTTTTRKGVEVAGEEDHSEAQKLP